MQQQYQDSSGKENNTVESTRTVYSIVARGPRAAKRVQAFVDDAFDWYKAMRKAEEEGSKRYFFVAVRPEKVVAFRNSKFSCYIEVRTSQRQEMVRFRNAMLARSVTILSQCVQQFMLPSMQCQISNIIQSRSIDLLEY